MVPVSHDAPITKEQFNGEALFKNHCLSCHGNNFPVWGAPLNLINEKIQSTPTMQYLSSLSDEEKSAIAVYLEAGPGDDGKDPNALTIVSYQLPLGTRSYMESALVEIFVLDRSPAGADSALVQIINDNVQSQKTSLGGPCTIYDSDCQGEFAEAPANASSLVSPTSNILRKGYTTKACEMLLSDNLAVSNALSKAGISELEAANNVNVARLYDHFFKGRTPTNDVISSLENVFHGAKADGLGNIGSWRVTMYPLCIHGGLDTL